MAPHSLPSSRTSGESTAALEKDEEAEIAISEKDDDLQQSDALPPKDGSTPTSPGYRTENGKHFGPDGTELAPSQTRAAILEVSGLSLHPELPNTYIVGWESSDDPTNPLNWAPWRRWGTVFLVSLITLITPLASTMFAAAVPILMDEFGVESKILNAFVVSIFVLGFVIGPLICSPLSELHGRLPVYHTSNFVFLCFTIACAVAPSLPALMVFRFMAGSAGSAALAIGGGTIADVIPIHHRGKAMVLFSMGPILGPVIGPVGGGFAVQSLGWRWIFWILTIASGSVCALCLAVMRETFAPKILKLRTLKLEKKYPHVAFRSKYWSPLTEKEYMIRSLVRPLRMLVNPIVLSLSLYLAVGYGYLYLVFTTLSLIFRTRYGFGLGAAGLSFLGSGIGSIIGAAVYAYWADGVHGHLSKKHGGVRPEFRLPALMVASVCLPAGLFMYGWTLEAGYHWMAPQVACGIFGFALVLVFVSVPF